MQPDTQTHAAQAVRPAAVAGYFYPAEPAALADTVRAMLSAARARGDAEAPVPKALIAPHAGYVYSGPIAASAYARLAPARARIHRVVLLGPAHRVFVQGLALPGVKAFDTPLGRIDVDAVGVEALRGLAQVSVRPDAHRLEHSLEVQLPFLQSVLERFTLVPLVVGEATAEQVTEVLERLWGGPETLIVVSTDLSHYHDQRTARSLDAATAHAIEQRRGEVIDAEHACGCRPLAGLLLAAQRHGLRARTLDLRNSGDTAGPRDQVVGYGAFALQ